MATQATITISVTAPSGTFSKNVTTSSEGWSETVVIVPGETTHKEVLFACPATGLQHFAILSDKALVVKTNNSTTPDDTINVLANVPFVWATGMYNANPLSEAVTKLYITNATAGDATVRIRAGFDATP